MGDVIDLKPKQGWTDDLLSLPSCPIQSCSKCGRDTVFFLGSRQPRYCANPENGGEDG